MKLQILILLCLVFLITQQTHGQPSSSKISQNGKISPNSKISQNNKISRKSADRKEIIPPIKPFQGNTLNLTILYEKSVDPAVSHTNNSLINSLINQYNTVFMDFGFRVRIDEILSYSEYYQVGRYYELAGMAGSDDFEGRRRVIKKLVEDDKHNKDRTNYVLMGVSSSNEDDIENTRKIFLKSDLKGVETNKKGDDISQKDSVNENNDKYNNHNNGSLNYNDIKTSVDATPESRYIDTNIFNTTILSPNTFECTGIFLFNFDSITNLYSDTLTTILKHIKKYIGEILNIEIPEIMGMMDPDNSREMRDFREKLGNLNIRDKIKRCSCKVGCNDVEIYNLEGVKMFSLDDIENVGQDKEKGKNGLNESVIKEFSDYDSLIRKFEDFISGENNKNKVGKNEKKDVPNNGNFKKSDRVEDKSSINGQNSTPNESKSVDENTLNSKKTAKVTSKDDNISNTPESSPISSEKGREISLNSHFSDIYTRALKTVSNYQNNTLKSPYPLSQGNFLNIANSETNKTLNELISTLKELIAKEEEIGKLKNNSANDFKRVLDRKIEKGGYNVRSVERDRFQFGKKESHPNSLSYGITRQRANSNS